MISPTAAPACLHCVEGREHHSGALGPGQQLDPHFHDDSEQALRSGHQRQQIESGRIEGGCADRDPFTVHGDHLELLDVVDGESVLQAVQPTRVLRHVPSDGARNLG